MYILDDCVGMPRKRSLWLPKVSKVIYLSSIVHKVHTDEYAKFASETVSKVICLFISLGGTLSFNDSGNNTK